MDNALGLESLDLPVSGMRCADCVERIRRALALLPGVEPDGLEVQVGRVRLHYYAQAISAASIRARIQSLGYGIPAPQRSRNPFRRLLERMGEANAGALQGKRLDCCKITDAGSGQ
jgi:cation transport ATPase